MFHWLRGQTAAMTCCTFKLSIMNRITFVTAAMRSACGNNGPYSPSGHLGSVVVLTGSLGGELNAE